MTDSTLVVPAQGRPALPGSLVPSALLAAADADADALADRLHDGALQALVVARYAADAGVRGADPALAREAVQEALVALRRLVWELRPRGAHDLPDALHELADRRAGPLDLQLDPVACSGLAPAARAAAYRFVQAALPADGPAAVHVGQEGARTVVTAGGTPADPLGWAARAEALGGSLDLSRPAARLLLPPDPAPDAPTEDDR